jgi:16S rRNA (uracil1498-N3)-methyltransferase
VFNGKHGEWQAEITDLSRKGGTLICRAPLRPQHICPDIWLCFAPVRKHRNSFILEKGTELGARRFQPVITAHTQFPKMNLGKARSQIIEAAEQTERLDVPELRAGVTLEELLSGWDKRRILFFADEAGGASPAADIFQEMSGKLSCAALLIGPEGGFSKDERARLRSQAFVSPVSLGPRILRADTAALALLSLWQAKLGDW